MQNGDSVLHYCIHEWAQNRGNSVGPAPDRSRSKIISALVAAGADVNQKNEVIAQFLII